MATATEDTTGDATATGDPTASAPDDWDGIKYVFYVTAGWLVATALAVILLMTVVPGLV